jgi:hypothetical protein
MKSCKTILSAAALILAAALALATAGSAQARQGTLNGTYAGFGTLKETRIGKDRVLTVLDHNALSVRDDPIFGQMTAHCWALGDFTKGVARSTAIASIPTWREICSSVVSSARSGR